VRSTPERVAYRQFDTTRAVWTDYTWGQIGQLVEAWIRALRREQLPAGARIAVVVPNSVEHVCMDQAALALGLVPVPMHVIDNPASLAYVLGDCGAALLFADSRERWQALREYQPQLPELKRVVHLGPGAAEGILRPLDEWLAQSADSTRTEQASEPQAAQALAAIVYTSGTTGRPKGVMLSHRNVLENVQAVMAAIPVREDDVFLSFLPLSHTLERTAGYYLPIAAGACVAFARSVSLLSEDLRSVRPTVLISVPRIYERAAIKLREMLEHSAIGRAVFALTVELGWQRFRYQQRAGPRPGIVSRALWPALDRAVALKVRARFGGRLRAAVTGGAAMTAQVARTFLACGVPLLQGYGMTESSPVVSCNTPEDNDPDSVGRPLPGIEVRLGERSELMVRGPSVMVGYWKRAAESAQAIEPDGWLHTGDQAELSSGRIYIRGRIKDIIVTSTGEKIAPVDVESAILDDAMFEQALVVGDGRPFIAALGVLDREKWTQQAVELGLAPSDPAALKSEAAQRWALARIAAAVKALPAYARPRAVALSLQPWTVAEGLITPTLKPKRPAIEQRFAAEIAELYRGHG
jgi:long-chain acyl-CoA synthetase